MVTLQEWTPQVLDEMRQLWKASIKDDLPASAWPAGWVVVVLTEMENLKGEAAIGLLVSSVETCSLRQPQRAVQMPAGVW